MEEAINKNTQRHKPDKQGVPVTMPKTKRLQSLTDGPPGPSTSIAPEKANMNFVSNTMGKQENEDLGNC